MKKLATAAHRVHTPPSKADLSGGIRDETLNPKTPEEAAEEKREEQLLNGDDSSAIASAHQSKGIFVERIFLFILSFGLFAGAIYAHTGIIQEKPMCRCSEQLKPEAR